MFISLYKLNHLFLESNRAVKKENVSLLIILFTKNKYQISRNTTVFCDLVNVYQFEIYKNINLGLNAFKMGGGY